MHVFYAEPRWRYLVRRLTYLPLCVFVIGFIAASFVITLALWAGVFDWGPLWRMNVQSVAVVLIVGSLSGIAFGYLLVTEGLSVRRAYIGDSVVIGGKEPLLSKRHARPWRIPADQVVRMDLRIGIPIVMIPLFRKVRLWLVRLTLKDGTEVEFRKYDPGFSADETWEAWRAFGQALEAHDVEVKETEVSTEIP